MSTILVGTVLHGYCGGFFGDVYEDLRVEAVGVDWVVAREESGVVHFATDPAIHQILSEYTGGTAAP